ncbi:MAG: DMT family transporter [Pseudomonadota bacterium]
MKRNEFLVLFLVCLIWAFHFIVIKWTVSEAPPLFYAAVRMGVLALVLAPFLRLYEGRMLHIICAGACMGGLNYAFMFIGIQNASPSAAAITVELRVPFAAVLSIIFLGESVRWRRITGIALAFSGVCLIALKPGEGVSGLGIALIAIGALFDAVGAVLVKSLAGVRILHLQAWVALMGAIVSWLATCILETGQWAAAQEAGASFYGAIFYSAFLSSLVAASGYYWLLQRHDITQIAPGVMMTPVMGVAFGVWLTGDRLTPFMIVGSIITVVGVFIVMVRTR